MTGMDAFYVALKGHLSGHWATGKTNGRKSFSLRNDRVSKTIQIATGTDIVAQFWKNQTSNLNFEFLSNEQHKGRRESLAASLRDFIYGNGPPPQEVEVSKGSTVVHLSSSALAIDQEMAVVQFFLFISQKVDLWASDILPDLLREWALNYGGRAKDSMWRTALRMARSARNTVAHANGQEVSHRVKEKEWRFESDEDLANYLVELLKGQGRRCALTGLNIEPDEVVQDRELAPSLDRINSDGHYEKGNLQVVCWFANRWKGDTREAEFRYLLHLVRGAGAKREGADGSSLEGAEGSCLQISNLQT